MYLLAIYSDNLCFKLRFEPGALTGKTCQKVGRFYGLTGRLGPLEPLEYMYSEVRVSEKHRKTPILNKF